MKAIISPDREAGRSGRRTEMINYCRDGEWSGYRLRQRADGLWEYSQWSAIQGNTTNRVVVLQVPADLEIADENDLDTRINGCTSKAEYLIHSGREIRCLRRGWIVQ